MIKISKNNKEEKCSERKNMSHVQMVATLPSLRACSIAAIVVIVVLRTYMPMRERLKHGD